MSVVRVNLIIDLRKGNNSGKTAQGEKGGEGLGTNLAISVIGIKELKQHVRDLGC